jgi:hypothetical protein
MARRLLTAIAATALLTAALAGQALAHPPTHLHCMSLENGNTHSIARGVTLQAPHNAFENLHFIVHSTVLTASHPTGGVTPDFGPTFVCPSDDL